MLKLSAIIKACGQDPSKPKSPTNPYGTGHHLALGYKVLCKGLMGPNPRLQEDSAFNPPAEILIQHVIGTITSVPDAGADVIPTERADEATFEIDPAQAGIDEITPMCMVCGLPPVL